MHSSKMRTARLLPVSPSMHCSGGRGVPGPGGKGGVPGPGGGCTWSWGGVPAQVLPPVDRQTRVKTKPSQTSFAGGKKISLSSSVNEPLL